MKVVQVMIHPLRDLNALTSRPLLVEARMDRYMSLLMIYRTLRHRPLGLHRTLVGLSLWVNQLSKDTRMV